MEHINAKIVWPHFEGLSNAEFSNIIEQHVSTDFLINSCFVLALLLYVCMSI